MDKSVQSTPVGEYKIRPHNGAKSRTNAGMRGRSASLTISAFIGDSTRENCAAIAVPKRGREEELYVNAGE